MKHIPLLLILLCLSHSQQQAQFPIQSQTPQQAQNQVQGQIIQLEDAGEIKQWVFHQEQYNQQFDQMDQTHVQSFQFGLRQKEDIFFKWDPPNRQPTQKLHLEIQVYGVDSIGQIIIPNSYLQTYNVQIFTKVSEEGVYEHIDTVYEHKFIPFQFKNTDFRLIRFRNNYPTPVIIVAQLQFPGHIINPAKTIDDDQLSTHGQALKHLLKEIENLSSQRGRRFMVSKTRLRKEEEHFGKMLVMTFGQLLAVVGTGILQAYFIRSLIDNRRIV